MDLSDQIFIIRNRLFEKRNILFLIVLSIVFIIIFCSLTIMKFSIENKNEIQKSNLGRSFIVKIPFEDVEIIKDIDNIEVATSIKYLNSDIFEVPELDVQNNKGIISLKPRLTDKDIEIISGKNIKNENEIVCPEKFYPHNFENNLSKILFFSSPQLIDKTITVTSHNESLNKELLKLKIVGIYKNKYMEEINTCYTNMKTYDLLTSKYQGYTESYDEKGNLLNRENIAYSDSIIRINDEKNISKVLNELDKLNIGYEKVFTVDNSLLNTMFFLPLIVSIIIIGISLLVIFIFLSKKNNNRLNNIGILKAIGFSDTEIISIFIKENIIITIVGYFIAIIVYFVMLKTLSYTILSEVIYNNYLLKVPYLSITISLIVFIVFIICVAKYIYNGNTSLSIQELLTNGE